MQGPQAEAASPGPGDVFAAECRRLGPRLMRDLGLTDVQAAGLLGNLGHESGGFRQLQEIAPRSPGSRGGWGLAQWTGPRRVAMEAWCRARGLDPASPEAGYGYLCAELRTTEAAGPCRPAGGPDPRGRHRGGVPALRAARHRRAAEPARLGAPGARRPPRRSRPGGARAGPRPGRALSRARRTPFPSRPGPPRAHPRRSTMTHRYPRGARPRLRRPPARRAFWPRPSPPAAALPAGAAVPWGDWLVAPAPAGLGRSRAARRRRRDGRHRPGRALGRLAC